MSIHVQQKLAHDGLRSRPWETRRWVLAGPSSTHPLSPLTDGGEAEGCGEVGLLTRWEALHEVYILLVGQRVGATARAASFSEAHVPVCVAR